MTKDLSSAQPDPDWDADRWIDALAGRIEPDDDNTQEAAFVRHLMLSEARAADALELDPQREQKLLARLREAEAASTAVMAGLPESTAAPGSAARPRTVPSLAVLLWQWLLPDSGNPWRLAGAAAGVFGLAMVLRALAPAPEADEHTRMKSPPPVVEPRAGGVADPVGVLHGGDPLQRALALQAALQQAGVSSDVFPMGAAARLEATVPTGRHERVQQVLQPLGLSLPSGRSDLVVEFRE